MMIQEFAHLMEDERYREGRLLRRFLELLEGNVPPDDPSFIPSTPVITQRFSDAASEVCMVDLLMVEAASI